MTNLMAAIIVWIAGVAVGWLLRDAMRHTRLEERYERTPGDWG